MTKKITGINLKIRDYLENIDLDSLKINLREMEKFVNDATQLDDCDNINLISCYLALYGLYKLMDEYHNNTELY